MEMWISIFIGEVMEMSEQKWRYSTLEEYFKKIANIRRQLVEITDDERHLELNMDEDMCFVVSDLWISYVWAKDRLDGHKALWFLRRAIRKLDKVMDRYGNKYYYLLNPQKENLEFIRDDFGRRKE